MINYYMGIDNGSTVCKAVIFDSKGNEVAGAKKNLGLITPKPGYSERDMDYLWKANCEVIRNAVKNSGLEPGQIKAAACTGHGKGLYLWGHDDKPCHNGIVSTDTRAWMYPERWKKDGTADRVFAKTYQNILACQPVSLLNWLKDNKPGVMEKIKWVFSAKDYIRFRLTGDAYAEITDFSGSNLLNNKEIRYDGGLLAEFGLNGIAGALPPLKRSTDICGKVSKRSSKETGLMEGTPVAGGMFDIDACAVAMDITDEENVAVIAGTWSINEYICKKPVLNKSIMMNSLYCIDGYYLIEECSPTSAGNNAWFADAFMEEEKKKANKLGISIYEYCDRLAGETEPEGQNVLFMPYIFGSNYNPRAKAAFLGLDSRHTRQHMARAVLEGIAFSHRVHLEKLLKNRKSTRAVRLAGGASHSAFWSQMFADVFRLPVETVDTKELGALGCAMAAAVAYGEYGDLKEAAASMVKIKTRLEPDPKNIASYEKKYNLYKQASGALDGLWENF